MIGPLLLPLLLLCALLAVASVGLMMSNGAAKRLHGTSHRSDRTGAARDGTSDSCC